MVDVEGSRVGDSSGEAFSELVEFLIAFRDRRRMSVSQLWEALAAAHADAFGPTVTMDLLGAEGSRIQVLPVDVRCRIFNMLTLPELARCSEVCKAWHFFANSPVLWHKVDLCGMELVKDKTIFGLSQHGQHLRSLKLSLEPLLRTSLNSGRRGITWKGMQHLVARCPNLTQLDLSMVPISDGVLGLLASRMPSLQELEISWCTEVTNNGVAKLKALKELRALGLRFCVLVSDTGVCEAIGECARLRALRLSGNLNITDDTLRCIAEHCRQVEELDVGGTAVTDVGVTVVADACGMLKHVDVGQCNSVTISSVEYLAQRAPNLERLNLHGLFLAGRLPTLSQFCPGLRTLGLAWCPNATDANARVLLKGCSSLRELSLEMGQDITDQTLQQVGQNCPKLGVLDVFCCVKLSDMGMVSLLRACPNMVKLNIGACDGIGDATLKEVARTAWRLRWLCTFKTRILDRSVQAIAEKCTKLEYLDLSDCQCITDRALEALSRHCHSLLYLDLTWCQGISAKAIAAFRSRHPKIRVFRHTHKL